MRWIVPLELIGGGSILVEEDPVLNHFDSPSPALFELASVPSSHPRLGQA